MDDIFSLRHCRPMFVVKVLSILMIPPGSVRRNKAANKELLPAPVLPTIPIYENN